MTPDPELSPCGAKARTRYHNPGWECTGRGLIAVTVAVCDGQHLPVVLPARALDAITEEPWWDIQPFHGGDHLHQVAPPRRPDGWRLLGYLQGPALALLSATNGKLVRAAESCYGEMYAGPLDSPMTWAVPG